MDAGQLYFAPADPAVCAASVSSYVAAVASSSSSRPAKRGSSGECRV